MADVAALSLAAGKGTLLGGSLGCLAGFVRFFLGKSDTKAAGASPPLQAPLHRGRVLGFVEEEGTCRPHPGRFVSRRLLGEAAGSSLGCREQRWQAVRQVLHEKAFLDLLSRFLAEARLGRLQTTPKYGPAKEHFAATLIQDELACFAGRHGPLKIEVLEFETGRPNLKVTYPGLEESDTVAFVSHFDVPAWARPDISLPSGGRCERFLYGKLNNLQLRGPGVAGLAHTTLLVLLLSELARSRPRLQRSVVCLFLAAQRAGEGKVGGAEALRSESLEELWRGPVFWLDAGASPPEEQDHPQGPSAPLLCIGALGSLAWSLRVKPLSTVSSIELAAQALAQIQESFAKKITAHAPEVAGVSPEIATFMWPAQIEHRSSSGLTHVSGIIRLAPGQPVTDVIASVQESVAEANLRIIRQVRPGTRMDTTGAFSQRMISSEPEEEALRPPPRRRSQRDRSPPPLPVGEVEPPKASVEMTWSKRPTVEKGATPVPPRRYHLPFWNRSRQAGAPNPASSPGASPKKRLLSCGSPVLEMAQDFEGLLTSTCSLGRMALQEALWAAHCESDCPPALPRFQHFVVNGSVCNARRFLDKGLDVQLLGFARCKLTSEGELDEDGCSLDGVREGYKVLLHLLQILEEQPGQQPVEPRAAPAAEHPDPKAITEEEEAVQQKVILQTSEEPCAEVAEPAGEAEISEAAADEPLQLTAPPSSPANWGRRAMSLEEVAANELRAEAESWQQRRALSDGGTPRAPSAAGKAPPAPDVGLAERQGREGGREAGRPSIAIVATGSASRSFAAGPAPPRTATERSLSDFREDAAADYTPAQRAHQTEENRAADTPEGEEGWFSWLGALYG